MQLSFAAVCVAEDLAGSDQFHSTAGGLPSDPAAYRTPVSLQNSVASSSSLPAESVSRITIGKITTYIDEPLNREGRPDYFAALNQRAGKNLEPEDNAAVQLIKAFGPETISEVVSPAYFKLLGARAPKPAGEYFVHCDEMVDRWIRGCTELPDPDADDQLRSQFVIAGQQPWSPADYPMVAAWLKLNEQALRTLLRPVGKITFTSRWSPPAVQNRR